MNVGAPGAYDTFPTPRVREDPLAALSVLQRIPKVETDKPGRPKYLFDQAESVPFASDPLRREPFLRTLQSVEPKPLEEMRKRWESSEVRERVAALGVKNPNDLTLEIAYKFPDISYQDLRTLNMLVLNLVHAEALLPEGGKAGVQRIHDTVGLLKLDLYEAHDSHTLASIVKAATPVGEVEDRQVYDFEHSSWDVLAVPAKRANLNLALSASQFDSSMKQMGGAWPKEFRAAHNPDKAKEMGVEPITFVGGEILYQFPNITNQDLRVVEQLVDYVVSTTVDPQSGKPPLALIDPTPPVSIESKQRITGVVSAVHKALSDSRYQPENESIFESKALIDSRRAQDEQWFDRFTSEGVQFSLDSDVQKIMDDLRRTNPEVYRGGGEWGVDLNKLTSRIQDALEYFAILQGLNIDLGYKYYRVGYDPLHLIRNGGNTLRDLLGANGRILQGDELTERWSDLVHRGSFRELRDEYYIKVQPDDSVEDVVLRMQKFDADNNTPFRLGGNMVYSAYAEGALKYITAHPDEIESATATSASLSQTTEPLFETQATAVANFDMSRYVVSEGVRDVPEVGKHGVYLTPLVQDGVIIDGKKLRQGVDELRVVSDKSGNQYTAEFQKLFKPEAEQGLGKATPEMAEARKRMNGMMKLISMAYISENPAVLENIKKDSDFTQYKPPQIAQAMRYMRLLVENRVGADVVSHDFPSEAEHIVLLDKLYTKLNSSEEDFGVKNEIISGIPGYHGQIDVYDTVLLGLLMRQLETDPRARKELKIDDLIRRFNEK